jgi:hypothetical protein
VTTQAAIATPPAADVATSNSMGAARRNGRNKQAVQPIEITQLWSAQHIREQQLNDARIGPVLKAVEAGTSSAELTNSPDREVQCYLRQWASMIVQNGVLYRTYYKNDGSVDRFQLVVPETLRNEFLTAVHVGTLCHTKSDDKNLAQVARHGYWATARRDVQNIPRVLSGVRRVSSRTATSQRSVTAIGRSIGCTWFSNLH